MSRSVDLNAFCPDRPLAQDAFRERDEPLAPATINTLFDSLSD